MLKHNYSIYAEKQQQQQNNSKCFQVLFKNTRVAIVSQ